MRSVLYWCIFSTSILLTSSDVQIQNLEISLTSEDDLPLERTAREDATTTTPAPGAGEDEKKEKLRLLQEKVKQAMQNKQTKIAAMVDDNMKANQLVMNLTHSIAKAKESNEDEEEEDEKVVPKKTKKIKPKNHQLGGLGKLLNGLIG